MWHEERRQRIRSLLTTFGRVSVDRVTEEFGVSRETIRRDLLDMEADGELRRVRGGAVMAEERREAPYSVRSSVRVKEKRVIAGAAARLVHSGQTLFLDAGSTTAILAERLAGLSGLTVITNSVDVATHLSEGARAEGRANRTVLIGGDFNAEPPATFGGVAVNELSRYQADLALLSPFGLDLHKGATSFDPREAEIARAMVASARNTVILADHSKIGGVSRVSYCSLGDITHLVVDARAARVSHFDAIRAHVPDVIVATR